MRKTIEASLSGEDEDNHETPDRIAALRAVIQAGNHPNPKLTC
jgi:hypothetical protein